MVRSKLREHIFKMLFQIEFNDAEDIPEHMRLYFEELGDEEESDLEYIRTKCRAIMEKIPEIDQLLNEKTTGWKTNRMNKVDLTLLRLAVYEILWDDDIPSGVAINEAVKLAHKFSGEDGPSFVNGVLSKFVK